MVIREDKVYRKPEAGDGGTPEPRVVSGDGGGQWGWGGAPESWHGRRGCRQPAGTHLRTSVHKEDGGVLLPWLHSMWLVDHAVEPHVRPRVEVEDFWGHVIRGAACRDREAIATQAGAHSWPTPTPHCLAPTR